MVRTPLSRPLIVLVSIPVALALSGCVEAEASPSASATDARATATAEEAPSETAQATSSPSADETDEASADEEVAIEGSQYLPEELTIAAGTEVTFENRDTFAHTVTEGTDGQAVDDPIADEEVAAGETVSVRFDEPGTYEITCIFHPTMQMTITVEG